MVGIEISSGLPLAGNRPYECALGLSWFFVYTEMNDDCNTIWGSHWPVNGNLVESSVVCLHLYATLTWMDTEYSNMRFCSLPGPLSSAYFHDAFTCFTIGWILYST